MQNKEVRDMAKTEIDSKAAEAANEEQVKETETQAEAEAVKEKDDDSVVEKDLALNQGEMLLLAIATSIDALAVGIMFAFTYDSLNIYWAIAIIGLTTFVLSIIGVIVGNFFGNKYKKKSEIAGGIILILIGVKILLEHLGIISF